MHEEILRRRGIVRSILKKCHITRDAKTPRDRIIAAIALVLRAVTKKDTHGRAREKLGTLNRRKEDKADTTKSL